MIPVLSIESCSTWVISGGQRVTLVSDVALALYAHHTLCIVGESGSGKTTCAHSILRLLPERSGFSTEGKILFEGNNLLGLTERKMQDIRGAKISMIFQDPSSALHPLFSVGDQVAEMFKIHRGLSSEEAEERAFDILTQVGLSRWRDFFEIYPHQISGGMKQRVMIAMAVCLGPQVLIADEPTTGLDLTVQKDILNLLKAWQKEHSIAMMLITHDFGVVAEMADEVAVMYAAEVVEHATVTELFSDPRHPYTQLLLASRPTKETRGKLLPVMQGGLAAQRSSGCQFFSRCPFALPKCQEEKVPTFAISSTHWVRCWLYEEKGK
jgi:peptide/nickel transport system ATP-binding protein